MCDELRVYKYLFVLEISCFIIDLDKNNFYLYVIKRSLLFIFCFIIFIFYIYFI